MKRIAAYGFVLALLLTLYPLSGRAEAPDAPHCRVMVASDLHYIAPTLTDGGVYYQRVLNSGDSKFMPYVEEITDAFFEDVLAERPEALILTGDLSFNGAIESHEALIEKLRTVEAAGIPVLVTTGNHDVYNSNAARYRGDSFSRVPTADTESFAALYADFGPGEALSVDGDSLSYVYPLNESTWVLVLDLNTAHDFCSLSADSLRWAEKQLKAAKKSGVQVLAAGHQNLFQHSIFRAGYVFGRSEQLSALFREYEVPLYLSGHLHIQHIQTEDGLTEICSSALCSYPCQYGLLTAGNGAIHYEARQLDMAAWAERNGRSDTIFQDFQAAAGRYMDTHFSSDGSIPDYATAEEYDVMLTYLKALNRAYFAGDLREIQALDPDGTIAGIWDRGGDLTALYVRSVLKELGQTHTFWDYSMKGWHPWISM